MTWSEKMRRLKTLKRIGVRIMQAKQRERDRKEEVYAASKRDVMGWR